LRRGEVTDSLRIGWNSPEERDRLTMLVMVGVRTEAHIFRSQVGIGSESDCLLGQLKRILDIPIQMQARKKKNWKVQLEGRVSVRMKYKYCW